MLHCISRRNGAEAIAAVDVAVAGVLGCIWTRF